MVRVFARAKSKPGHVNELRLVLQKLVRASRAESGVRTYDLFETDEGGEFLFREEYVGKEEFDAHKASRHVRVAVSRAAPLMDGDLTLWIVHEVSEEQSAKP